MLQKLRSKIQKNWKEILLILFALIISGVAHGYNMFGFPYFENDEGVYLSQAWTLISQGSLAPYTYWYDHAPAGWIFTSLWLLLTDGVFTFGFSLNSGRVFMLVLHIASTYLVMKTAKKLTGSLQISLICALVFSLSPLGLYFQRRLLLDNIMIFWVLWSFYLILGSGRKLSHFIWSSIMFGVAILTKENAIFFVPGFLCALYFNSHVYHRRFAILNWFLIVGLMVSLYFLFSILKGEFFPFGGILGGDKPHVSLIETLSYQYSRKSGTTSGLENHFLLWIKQDGFLILGGIFSNIFLLFLSLFKSRRHYLGLSLLGLFFWVFLGRGSIVIEFYIVPLLPLLCLYIGITIFEFTRIFSKLIARTYLNLFLTLVSIIIMGFYFQYSQISRSFGQNITGHYFFKSIQTGAEVEAIKWIRDHVEEESIIVIDNYGYLEFHDPSNPSGKIFPNAHWYWKIDQDVAIKNDLLHNSSESIDFVAVTPQMYGDLVMGASPLTSRAIDNSILVTGFNTEGWGVEIWATRYPSKILKRSWSSYKSNFLINNQKTIDPNNNEITTSEGQSYALLKSVWMDDRATFDNSWYWTKSNMQQESGVFGWKWGKNSAGKEELLDKGAASDAESDIALALLFAYKKWEDPKYLQEARIVLDGMWNTEVKSFRGKNYLVPGDWAKNQDHLIINPSYLSPYAYRIFAEADKKHDWMSLVDSSYEVLEGCMSAKFDLEGESVYLPPNWCQIDNSGKFVRPDEEGLNSIDYSYDAVRTMWRLGLDYRWYQEPRAKNLLDKSGMFLAEKWNTDKKILVGYTHDGQPWENYESVLGYSTALANFAITNPDLAKEIYEAKVLDKFYEDFDEKQHYWEDPKNYYTQNWAWFGTALYSNNLPNIWNTQ